MISIPPDSAPDSDPLPAISMGVGVARRDSLQPDMPQDNHNAMKRVRILMSVPLFNLFDDREVTLIDNDHLTTSSYWKIETALTRCVINTDLVIHLYAIRPPDVPQVKKTTTKDPFEGVIIIIIEVVLDLAITLADIIINTVIVRQ
jgi:hypothetical protein